MIILGIDPGLATVGYGIIEYRGNSFTTLDYGAILTEAHTEFNSRLLSINAQLINLINMFKPDAVAIEELFFNKNIKTAIAVAQARGAILLTCAQNNVPTFEYTPLQVKQAVVGYGRADKNQVQQMTKILLNLKAVPKPDDTADALAIAICHAHSNNSIMR
ncbi:MAG: crossover junction endodeoxyribonuclease RuvC [Clostridia bacterium]|nr:crossover junction endodeoxyribonuclease RuvC [Clostridia bacterium]MBQ4249428.1 crossover junction endodeoxyribonuclease RuvC [Clostridia bacterium]